MLGAVNTLDFTYRLNRLQMGRNERPQNAISRKCGGQ